MGGNKQSKHHRNHRDYNNNTSYDQHYNRSQNGNYTTTNTTTNAGGNQRPAQNDIYAPDANSSGNIRRPEGGGLDDTSRTIGISRERPDAYMDVLKPIKGPARMKFNPDIPQTLTPKGYTTLRLMMSVANKEYETLVRRLKRENKLWEDPKFPANDSSIGIDSMRGKIEWKRPKDINPRAEFFIDGVSRFDIEQGAVGDCWLLAVVSSIASYPQLFNHVLPKEQKMQSPDYVGVFRVRFWRFGQWVEVLVDDRVPVNRGTNQLAFMHSTQDDEFWSALLEKAYAKLNGTYNHLSGGTQSEAMEDLTGGVCETLPLERGKRPADLLEQMVTYAKRCCLMGCSVDSTVIEAKLDNGLIAGHAYSVTGVKSVTYQRRQQWLVRCRNPWGGRYEWKGPWCDRSPEWSGVSQADRRQLDVEFHDDGEFWMSYEDFVSNFTRLEVCHLGLESLEHDQDFRGKRRLEESIFSGQWQKNVNAGGCVNNARTFSTNPQYRFTLTDPDPDDNEHKATVIIGLMQRDVRKRLGSNFYTIGFMVYQVDKDQTTLLKRAQLMSRRPVGKSSFSNMREVTAHLHLPLGDYVIIPSTFEPNIEASFIVRVLCQVAVQEAELDDNTVHPDLSDDITEAIKAEDMVLNEDAQIEEKFKEMEDRKTKSINAHQLAEILNNSTLQDINGFQKFDIEMCRSMVASADNNLTGMIELPEVMDLWKHAKAYKMIFLKYDEDNTGAFDSCEFREALDQAGYNVSNRVFNCLVHRYGDPVNLKMRFSDFMLCCFRLKNVFDIVEAQPKSHDGAPIFTKDDYIRMSVYT